MSDIPVTSEVPTPTTLPGSDEVVGYDDDDRKVAATDDRHDKNADSGNVPEMEAEVMETIHLTSDQQTIYNAAHVALNESLSEFLPAPIPRVVSVELVQSLLSQSKNQDAAVSSIQPSSAGTNITSAPTISLGVDRTMFESRSSITPIYRNRRNEMAVALDELENLEKEEQALATKASLTRYLTELLTGQTYENSAMAIKSLDALEAAVPRRVCQHPFRKNDIVWVCRTCQADETCVLCHTCFSQSNHDGHDVAFYHAQAGGCCDCGDPDGTFLFCDCRYDENTNLSFLSTFY
jgi:hypothetical protein